MLRAWAVIGPLLLVSTYADAQPASDRMRCNNDDETFSRDKVSKCASEGRSAEYDGLESA